MKSSHRSGTRKPSCPIHALAVEASEIIRAQNDIEKRHAAKKERPLDAFNERAGQDRLDAITTEASFREPRSHDGAAFQLYLAGSDHDLLSSSTFHSEAQREEIERRCARLIEAATAYLMDISTSDGATPCMKWLHAAQYYGSQTLKRAVKKQAA